MKILFRLLLIAVVMACSGLAMAKDSDVHANPYKEAVLAVEIEPNDDCTTATELVLDDPVLAAIDPETDHDWYAFTADAGQCVSFETFPGESQSGGDTRMWLWDSDCVTQLAFNDDGGGGAYSLLEYEFTAGGTYYIEIDEFGNNAVIGSYVLSVIACPPPPEEDGSVCNFASLCYDWDFAQGDQGFVPTVCDGGAPVWEYGATTFVPGAPGDVWGTVLNDNYVVNAGEGLLSPAFTVEAGVCDWLEVTHYINTERFSETSTLWDACNVTVDGQVILPMEGYSTVANASTLCVGDEEAWGGASANGPIRSWGKACFDLSQFVGMTIQVSFDFGSDSSVVYPGWYLSGVKVGTTDRAIGTEGTTWGNLKSLYR